MYSDEEAAKEAEAFDEDLEEDTNIGFNEVMLVERLLQKNPLLRKIKLVIEWLEDISSRSKNLEMVRQKIGEFSETCSSWSHTLHHLKNQKSFNKKENYIYSNREFVDELVSYYF